jgi:uncharacterized protein DUF5677
MAESLAPILEEFTRDARSDLESRWAAWKLDLSKNVVHEVVGGLLARQVSLATEMARNPDIWNPHIGPLVLRSMVDVYISLSWILMAPEERSQQFIAYGLGQIKLQIEHLKEAAAQEASSETQTGMELLEDWLNSQRLIFLTEVNIGSWSGTNTRKMAEESGCLDIYMFAYTIFSEAAHSMWHHISIFNLKRCSSPLHRLHSVPHAPQLDSQVYFLHMAAKYLEITLMLVDERLGLQITGPSAFDKMMSRLSSLSERIEAEAQEA